ncbi:class I SAM-dependent methyltransferase [Neisseria chenwenguii]|uniref:Methyltransferase n=1 Tax=Neisseria chenwenguii TaxID=1853278 RepID=A0A220S116_9NEIS|nr:class I SAM-dependent methyltransferase [Neisseria chenwenguii]ASK27190.1 methyltransferase [Neisseria chenwenguii]ROV54892.1 class I SAM-dependent methyltransferase [Neisseria chenwenguii]
MDTAKISPAAVSALSATMLITLWAKAVETLKPEPLLRDAEASRMVAQIDFDFSIFETAKASQVGCCARTLLLDGITRRFLGKHPDAVVVQLGAGLDARYERLGRPPVTAWYDLDLPEVIELRRTLLPESGNIYLAASIFDTDWMQTAAAHGQPVLLLAEGVLMYFDEGRLKNWISLLKRHLPNAEAAFDTLPVKLVGRQKQHDALRKMGGTPPEFKWDVADAADVEALGWEVMEQHGLSGVAGRRYPLLLRLMYLTAWGRRNFDQKVFRTRIV